MTGMELKSAVVRVRGDAELGAAPGGSLARSCVADNLTCEAKDEKSVCRSQSFAWAAK